MLEIEIGKQDFEEKRGHHNIINGVGQAREASGMELEEQQINGMTKSWEKLRRVDPYAVGFSQKDASNFIPTLMSP